MNGYPWLKGGRGTALVTVLLVAGGGLAVMAGGTLADDAGKTMRTSSPRCVTQPLDETRVIDKNTLFVQDDFGAAALLHMSTPCLIDDNEAVGLKFYGGGQICGPNDVDVTGSVMTMPTPCIVKSVERLSKERAAEIRNAPRDRNQG